MSITHDILLLLHIIITHKGYLKQVLLSLHLLLNNVGLLMEAKIISWFNFEWWVLMCDDKRNKKVNSREMWSLISSWYLEFFYGVTKDKTSKYSWILVILVFKRNETARISMGWPDKDEVKEWRGWVWSSSPDFFYSSVSLFRSIELENN